MPQNKPRLQLALYARPKHPGTYHYALFISPKGTKQQPADSATKHHVKNTLQNTAGEVTQPWRYERLAISDVQLEHRLLVRINIAKVISPHALERIIEAVPVYQIDDPNQIEARSFTCLTWVQATLEALRSQDVVTGLGEWVNIQKAALEYVERKMEVGRWKADWKGEQRVPMLDLRSGREIVG
ncbi:uncharacterized protein K460DRAFT_288373 [Cucurbitaria berberidis CBS 394.84]|uniref:Uncharacterized protein n=1 Tax=Cucurbitaria berberidis CBS 394.84 TaxID=1168544 RepID=A0A9P4GD02_9PLEO|nr:uncharacterized protein K460DRAFT_288373 [Cucurbitaria berberidis CBS 394.84]KAF1843271.1 hypothetical protein K460DRAFT_288373 [Cucurbitaria berberidis CBS 394.84]